MKIAELFSMGLFEGDISDFLARSRDPFRKSNTGTPMSPAQSLKFHQDALEKLGPGAPKSHREYHERFIRKLLKKKKD